MTKNNIVVCDGDAEYVQAFTAYLMEHIPDIMIYSFTSEEALMKCQQTFQVGIFSQEFLQVLEFGGREMVEEKLYLCDENIAAEYEHLPMVYKYQSMEIVEEMIRRMLKKNSMHWGGKRGETKILGIYSPISHELSMPFGLAVCQVLRESGRVLFLDIEENSIMTKMMGREREKSLMDLMYFVLQQEHLSVENYVNSFMGIDYISPFSNPEELNEVSQEAWERLMQCVLAAGYDSVVILFGRTIPGFCNMVSMCRELIVLGKPGDYYQKSQKNFLDYAMKRYQDTSIQEVSLPLSAGNLVDGAYAMEELLQGKLGLYVRKLMREGIMAQENLYGRA